MTDEFERRLAVALKTAVRDLPSTGPAPAPALDGARVDGPVPARRSRRPRVVLVTAVLLALALVVGGSWWALSRDVVHTPPASAACTTDDVRLSRATPPADAGDVLTLIVVTALSACVLSDPPVVTFRGQDVPWQSLHGAPWGAPELASGATLRFALSTTLDHHGAVCDGVARTSRAVEARVAGNGPALLAFDVGETVCGPVSLTLYGPGPTAAPCTAADATLTREGTPPPGDPLVLGLVALRVARACTLTSPPAMTTDGRALPYEATPADPADDGSWRPVAVAAGASVRFAVTQLPITSGHPCAGPVTDADLAVSFGGGATAGPTLHVAYAMCGGQLAVTTYTPATTAAPCAAADLTATSEDIGRGEAGVGIPLVATTVCELDRPPTVVVGGGGLDPVTARFAGRQPDDDTPWLPEVLQPGDTARFALAFAAVAHSCPYSPPRQVEVSVRIGSATSVTFPWTLTTSCALEGLALVTGS